MQITFLGTGTSQGVPIINCKCEVCNSQDKKDKRLRCSILIQLNGLNYVVDVGPDFRQQMLRTKIEQLNGILITHEHNDHMIGLDDIRPYYFTQKEEMSLYTSQQVLTDLSKRFQYIFDKSSYPGVPKIKVNKIENKPFSLDGEAVTPIMVKHGRMDVMGFRIKDFTYITDANFISEKEKEKIKGSKVLVLNALHREKHYSHFNLDEAIELIEELEPDRAYLTHISHRMGTHAITSAELPKNIHLAFDGLQLHLPKG